MSYTTPRPACALGMGFALAALATAAAVHAQPRVIYADAHAPAGGNGASWGAAFRDLQDALVAANADPSRLLTGIEVHISQGIYTPDRGTGDQYASFVPHSAVTLMGGYAGLLSATPDHRDEKRFVTVLSGDLDRDDLSNFVQPDSNNSRTVLDIRRTDIAYVSGLTISGGSTTFDGGAVVAVGTQYSQNHRLFLTDCVVRNNWSFGAGVVRGGSPSNVFINCSFLGNVAFYTPIVDCPGLIVQQCTFRGNQVEGATSMIGTFSENAVLFGCLFADNRTAGPGIIVCPESSPLLKVLNCTFVSHPVYPRAAIWLDRNAAVLIRNSIFTPGGTSPYSASAIQVIATPPAYVSIDQSVMMPNGDAGVYPLPIPTGFYHVTAADPRFISPSGFDSNPLTWQDNDYHLSPMSPAIDRADVSDLYYLGGFADRDRSPAWDDSLVPNRGIGTPNYVDLGCYEYQGQLCSADFNASGTLSPQDIFDFLNAWFAADPRADFNSGGLSPLDIFDFIGAWFSGC